jgi:hypothetical protein
MPVIPFPERWHRPATQRSDLDEGHQAGVEGVLEGGGLGEAVRDAIRFLLFFAVAVAG